MIKSKQERIEEIISRIEELKRHLQEEIKTTQEEFANLKMLLALLDEKHEHL
jgi:hypothetical protein